MTAALSDASLDGLSSACRLDLRGFRRSHVEARVHRALDLQPTSDLAGLRARIAADPVFRSRFQRLVAISHTGFFRDPEQFDVLRGVLREDPAFQRPVRAWSAGCATGEEAWSIAAMLTALRLGPGSLVLGSDLLAENIAVARHREPTTAELGGSVDRALDVRFEVRDLLTQGVPGGGWDLVLCRNTVIYFTEDVRDALHERLARSLRPGGYFLIGSTERVSRAAEVGLEVVRPFLYRKVA